MVMNEPTVRRLAWSVGGGSILLMVGGLLIMFVDRNASLPSDVGGVWSLAAVLDVVVNLGVPILGIVVSSRRPQNPIGWLLLAAGIVLGIANFAQA
jgi:hypothetical protein